MYCLAHVICRRVSTCVLRLNGTHITLSVPYNRLLRCIVLPWGFWALQRHHLVQRPTHGFPRRAVLPSRRFSRPQGFFPNFGLHPCFMMLPFLSFNNLQLSHPDVDFSTFWSVQQKAFPLRGFPSSSLETTSPSTRGCRLSSLGLGGLLDDPLLRCRLSVPVHIHALRPLAVFFTSSSRGRSCL